MQGSKIVSPTSNSYYTCSELMNGRNGIYRDGGKKSYWQRHKVQGQEGRIGVSKVRTALHLADSWDFFPYPQTSLTHYQILPIFGNSLLFE